MEDITVTGIVLSSMPYREKDKLIHLFTVELGKITAILKGVSAPNAKLKFAGQPFCFAKFDLTLSKDMYVVKGCELIDSFFEITEDYDAYMLSISMLEICSSILKPYILAENLFLNLVKSLQNIVYNEVGVHLVLLKFVLSTLKNIGYGLNFDVCDNCGMKFIGDIKFDVHTGTFRCSACSGGVKVPPRDFTILKMVDNTDINRLHTLKLQSSIIKPCLKLAFLDIQERLNIKLKSIDLLSL